MMEFFGLTEEDYAHERQPVEVCPDNWEAVRFFAALGPGSWNMGPGGPTGLRYEAFREVRLARRVRSQDWPELFEQVTIMESAALDEMHREED